jgi:hypothetical protein
VAVELIVRLVALIVSWFVRQAAKDTEPTWVRIRRPHERVRHRQRYFRGLSAPNPNDRPS